MGTLKEWAASITNEDKPAAVVTLTLSSLGNFLALWSAFELTLEILLLRELRISEHETSILCTGKGVDGKIVMLTPLLRRTPKGEKGLSLVNATRGFAERNNFVHGFFRINRETGELFLISRSVKHDYTATSKHLSYLKMDAHLTEFSNKYQAVKDFFKITEKEIDGYTDHIVELAERPKPKKRKDR